MSDESSGAGQGALPPRDGLSSRSVVERPAVRLAQVAGGQYLITSQPHGMPALAQISATNVSASNVQATQGGVTRIISLSPSRGHVSPLRPSVAHQNIVNALTKPRPGGNVRLQLFPAVETSTAQTSVPARSPLKRAFPTTPEDRDSYSVKLRRVMDHRIVRSKLVKEKYNEHLMEKYYLETSGNILDLPHFAKRLKTQHYISHLRENAIDPREAIDEDESQLVVVESFVSHSAPSNNIPVVQVNQQDIVSSSNNSNTFTVQSTTASELNTSAVVTTANSSVKMRMSSSYPASSNQEQIVEKAKQEAYVVQRISDLQKEGLWSEKRLPKVQEMARGKAHWDFLLEEMVWLAADFAQERKWKKAAAKKCARMVQKYFQDKALAAQRAEKAQEQHLKRIAAFCAKEIKNFWSNVEKLVEYKQNTRLEEKRKKALDQHLSFIVDQTEKYSQLLAEGMNKSLPNATAEGPSAPSSKAPSRTNSDDEFQPDDQESTDDEETIAQEEARGLEHDQGEEVAALQRESEMDLATFLNELPKDYLQNRDTIVLSGSEEESVESEESDAEKSDNKSKSSKKSSKEKDEDFVVDSSSEGDDEGTIQEQEVAEGTQNHQEEINDLNAENEMSVEELRNKYGNLPPLPNERLSSSSESDDSDSSVDADKEESSDNESEASSDVDMSMSEDECQKSDEVGLKSLLDDSQNEGDIKTENQDLIDDAAAIAESIQPKGNTLSSTSVVTPIPFLLKYQLREYQHIGLDWLVTMFERKLNGILADEMGLGKTIQTIALLAHLACEKENWGPHLIIVPTSVMLNWEMECKKWCPAFKILTYYGTQKERKQKRMGWTKPNAFHVCITSYKLVIQDHQSFRRKKWKYLILDEAQNIKNFKSQRWQLLLNFTTQQRLLLTGTPLQNNLMELWSLMHFLMPHVFQSHREFKEWFSNPVTGMIEGNSEYNESIIKRLHKVLRPFLLRRLKCEVEKQMPKKYEHVVMCRLSKRQRFLYDDYMSRAKTKETLASGNLLSVINVLMQLRKVCNHPNLFEVRPTTSPFQCDGVTWHIPSIVYAALEYDVWKHISLYSMNLNLVLMELYLNAYQCYRMRQYQTPRKLIEEIDSLEAPPPYCPPAKLAMRVVKHAPPETKAENKGTEGPKNAGNIFDPKPGQAINSQTNLKLKISPQNVLHLVPHNSPLKVVTHQVNTTQGCTGGQNTSTTLSLSSVLKPDKLMFQPGIAQLVQTSSGKHILLTPTPNVTMSTAITIPGSTTVVTTGGQRLTLLPKQAVTAGQVTNMSKGLPKIQLMSVTTSSPVTTIPTTTVVTPNIIDTTKNDEDKETGKKTVGNKFLDKIYSQTNQSNSLDVRWKKQKMPSPKRNRHSVHQEGNEIEIVDHYKNKLDLIARVNERRCGAVPLYGKDFHDSIKIFKCGENPAWGGGRIHCLNALFNMNTNNTTDCLKDILYIPEKRIEQFKDIFDRFIFYVPAVHAPEPELRVWHPNPSTFWGRKQDIDVLTKYFSKPATCLHPIASAMVTQFPDPRLIQYDCGKLQTLDRLLRKLKTDAHRVLIFTQMTKMLDVLEAFLNFHGHIYLRLDGSTKVDQRQVLMERFNGDTRIFAFILSTRSGGIGVNLTGADTVIFYDSDWNPTMDAQAQDRCHRIGQTRDVHIYRLVSERTIEENILKKANQKRLLGDLAIEGGNFTTAYFKSSTIQDLFEIDASEESAATRMSEVVQCSKEREKYGGGSEVSSSASTSTPVPPAGDDKTAMGALESALAACEDDQDVLAARTAKAEAVADLAEFDENIPLEEQEKDKDKEMEISRAELEVENLVKQLTPIERYAMRFIEETEAAWSAEQLAAAEREIDEQKREWEQNRLAALREEEKRRARELEEENDMITYSREDATNQVSTKNKRLNIQGTSSSSSGNVVKRSVRKAQTKSRSVKRGGGRGKNLRNKLAVADNKDNVVGVKKETVSDYSDNDVRNRKRCKKLDEKTEDDCMKDDESSKTENVDANEEVSNELEEEISQAPTETSDSTYNTKINGGGTDNEFKSELGEEESDDNNDGSNESSESSDSCRTMTPVPANHVDHNSPRTRSRGTVAINLWTLDVSPILPGVKPVKNSPGTNNYKKDKKIKEEDIKKCVRRANSTMIENKNNRKIVKVKNSSLLDGNKIVNSKVVKNVKNKNTENTKAELDSKEIKDQESINLKNENLKKFTKDKSKKVKSQEECEGSMSSITKIEINVEKKENLNDNKTSEIRNNLMNDSIQSTHSKDATNSFDESPIVFDSDEIEKACMSDSSLKKINISNQLQDCNYIADKYFGKNGKICKVVITDIMSDGTLSKELCKYTAPTVAESSGELTTDETLDVKLSEDVSKNEISNPDIKDVNTDKDNNCKAKLVKNMPHANETQRSKKANVKKVIETKKPFVKRRRLVPKQNSSLDNWLIKSPSPKRNVSTNLESDTFPETTENKSTSDSDNLVNKHVSTEVTENIAVKAEITKVATDDVGDIANAIKEDSLKRTCNDSESSLEDNGIKTNKIIKTA